MSHVDRDVLALAALGEPLPQPDATHLAGCPRCRDRAAAFERAVADPGAAGPPPETVGYGGVRGGARAPSPRTARTLAAALTAVAVLAGAGAVAATLARPDGPRVVAEVALEGLNGSAPGTATLLEGPEGRSLLVDAAMASTDGFYELWLLNADQPTGLVSLGTVDPGRPQPLAAAVDTAAFPVVDVSREPADGDPSHSGDSVLRGRLPAPGG